MAKRVSNKDESNKDRFQTDLSRLISIGKMIREDLVYVALDASGQLPDDKREIWRKFPARFGASYQSWL